MTDDEDPKVLQAAEWLLRLDNEAVRAEDIGEWQRWMAANARNRATFERVQALYSMVPRIDEAPWPGDREVLEDRYDGSIAVGKALVRNRSQEHSFRWAMAATAAVVFISGGIWWSQFAATAPVLTTGIGERRTFSLADGSQVTLGGDSRLRLAMTGQRRELDLETGEAFFDVEKDANRPFVVRAGGTRITAIGTAFNVRRAIDRVQVAVTSGAVQVVAPGTAPEHRAADVRLEAGHQAVVAAGRLLAPAPAELPAVIGRSEGRLHYTWEPLRYVVADLMRYSEVPIELSGPGAGELLVTGTVLEEDLRGWLEGLEEALPVRVTFSRERITIQAH